MRGVGMRSRIAGRRVEGLGQGQADVAIKGHFGPLYDSLIRKHRDAVHFNADVVSRSRGSGTHPSGSIHRAHRSTRAQARIQNGTCSRAGRRWCIARADGKRIELWAAVPVQPCPYYGCSPRSSTTVRNGGLPFPVGGSTTWLTVRGRKPDLLMRTLNASDVRMSSIRQDPNELVVQVLPAL